MPLTMPITISLLMAAHSAPTSDVTALAKRCATGAATACFEWGLSLDTQGGDPAQAGAAFIRACEGGDMRGCNSAGVMLRQGRGMTRDLPRARRLVKQACDAKLAIGCFNHGAMLASGEGGPGNREEALRLLDLACTAELAPACSAAGALTLEASPVRAQTYFTTACGLNDGEGCYNLAQLLRGKAQARAAFRAYKKACRLKVPAGCNWCGLMAAKGEGVKAQPARAVAWMVEACEGGFPEGCFNAAVAHVKGRGVTRDHQRAGKLFTQACEGGVTEACDLLARQKRRSRPKPQ